MAHGGERKIRRGSSGLETDFRVCRVVRVGESLVYYRAPTKETLPRTTPEDSSSHRIARSGTRRRRFEPSYGQFSFKYSRQEWASFGNDPSTSLSLPLSLSISLSFFDPNGLFRESMTRESDLKTRRGFSISLRDYIFSILCYLEEDDGSNIFLSLKL